MEKILRSLAKKILGKYKPKVIGFVGDQEKSTVSRAIFDLIDNKNKGNVRISPDNYDDKASVVLDTILGDFSKDASLGKVFRAIKTLLFRKHYPKYLLIEYPVNALGKIEKFLDLIIPDIAIISAITNRNIEYFGSIEKEVKEKSKIIPRLSKEAVLILNIDDKNVSPLKDRAKCKVITYGFGDGADIRASEFSPSISPEDYKETGERILGINFKLNQEGNVLPFFLPGVIGSEHVRGAMATVAFGMALNINLVEVSSILAKYEPARGRLALIPGVKKSMIIDDSYDASLYSVRIALETLYVLNLESPREKFAVIGSITNLGRYTEGVHREIGQLVAQNAPDYLCVVGERARDIIRGARDAGMPEDRCWTFAKTDEAGKFLQNRLEKGDLVLVTGSHDMGMENIVKELMADPRNAKLLLARQK